MSFTLGKCALFVTGYMQTHVRHTELLKLGLKEMVYNSEKAWPVLQGFFKKWALLNLT